MSAETAATTGQQAHAPVRALVLLASAYLIWAVHDTMLKLLADGYGLFQILFFGRLLSIPLAFGLAMRSGGFAALRPSRPGMHVVRSLFGAADMYLFVAAIAIAPLADVFTITFVAPLVMTILSVVFLGERVGWRRWTAVAIGFLGVVVVMQPSGAGSGPASLMALGSATTYAVFLIMTRTLTATESVPSLVFWNSLLVLIVAAVLMIPEWRWPDAETGWMLAAIAVTGAAGQWMTTEAFRLGEASMLAPLQYLSLLWAAGLGYLVFADVPTPSLWAGAAIIIGAALYVVHREARRKQAVS
ncbi:MAG: DMT family transporter [Hyphomicrobiaceae bacterium]